MTTQAEQAQYEARKAILSHALFHVPFEGWTPTALKTATTEAGFDAGYDEILFPNGSSDLVAFFIEETDKAMLEKLAAMDLDTMRVRDRVAEAIKARITYLAPHKAAIAPTLRFFAQPHHAAQGTKLLAHTSSLIWYAIGDTSTDYNYYTKRTLLAGVYSSTLLYWISDESDDNQDTWEFLDRRISNVLRLGSLPHKLGKQWEKFSQCFPFANKG